MAVTSIWAIKGRLDQVISYIQNENKTVETVIDYTMNGEKTNEKEYVTCVNCDQFDPQKSMMNTKKLFNDNKEIVLYHGYQSFNVGEVHPETAHEIGVKLVNELYANCYECIVTTQLDKKYIHNHILINATSFIDGKRFCNTKKDYRMLRETSDNLCREYGLSVIQPKQKQSKQLNYYAVKTYLNDIKNDIDDLTNYARTSKQFFDYMRLKGYQFEYVDGEDCIIHPYYTQPIPLKSLGERYHMEEIEERIYDWNTSFYEVAHIKNFHKLEDYHKVFKYQKSKSLWSLYIVHFLNLQILPKPSKKLSAEARRELRKLDQYMVEIEMLAQNEIKDITQLDDYQSKQHLKLDDLIKQRQKCYQGRMKATNQKNKEDWSTLAKQYTPKITKLRNEIKACERIRNRSFIKDKEQELSQLQQNKIKGGQEHERN